MGNSLLKLLKASLAAVFVGLMVTASDASWVHGQQGDVTPPQLSLPGSITVEATSRLGVVVSFSATASDAVDPNPVMVCNPASGLVFRLGNTIVNCTATDASGNAASGSFPVTVRDISPPVLILPAGIEAAASNSQGALVIYTATASDTVDPDPVVVCNPSSGSVFPIGATTVSCTAADASGNVGGDHFVVNIGDASPPTIVGRAFPAPNANGWNSTDVSVGFACTDVTSGILSCEGAVTFSDEGPGHSARGTATDLAGNTATAIISGINIDKSAPLLTITSPAQGAQFVVGTEVLANWQAEDGLSGMDTASGTVDSGTPLNTRSLGLKSFTVTATDLAGNHSKKTHTYTVLSPFAVFVVVESHAEVEAGAAEDDFLIRGIFELGILSNGLDPRTEEVAITFNKYRQSFPVGSFRRNAAGDGYRFDGPSGSVTRIDIQDDGEFLVRGAGLSVSPIFLDTSVPFSLRVGDDFGRATILFRESGPFRLVTRQARDFFGTVTSVGKNNLTVQTQSGPVQVAVTDQSQVRLRHKPDAGLADLVVGDSVAVSLKGNNGDLIADQILLIPGKTLNKHVSGEVVALTDTSITIRPIRPKAEPITLSRGPGTRVGFYLNETELAVGSFVVVGTVFDPATGLLATGAKEINVSVARPASGQQSGAEGRYGTQTRNRAIIEGIFEGVDEQGNWIVSGNAVALGPETKIEGALAVGRALLIEAELKPDGTLLAREVEGDGRHLDGLGRAELTGIFQKVHEGTGAWIISGLEVSVSATTDTDGVPTPGALVNVRALLDQNGSLVAREVQNLGGSTDNEGVTGQLKLVGVFQGVDAQGKWIVNGAEMAVGPSTQLEGFPGTGRSIRVKAMVGKDGSLLAWNIEAKNPDRAGPRTDAEVRGAIEEILGDGTLVVNGIQIGLSVLTEVASDLAVGDFVEVEALILEDGSLLGREISLKAKAEAGESPESSKVKIEGIIEEVEEDGTLVVNGIRVASSRLSEISGNLLSGGLVKVEGLLLADGSVLARELKGEGRRATASATEVKLEGVVELVTRDDADNVVSVVVDGLAVSLAALTETVGRLETGSRIEVRAVITGGALLASKIEALEDTGPARASKIEVEGIVEALLTDDAGRPIGVTVNGLDVVIGPSTALEGALTVDDVVKIKGDVRRGIVRAGIVVPESQTAKGPRRVQFDLRGSLDSLSRDDAGNVTVVVVDGNRIVVETLTRITGALERGAEVAVEGIVSGGELLATKVRGQ